MANSTSIARCTALYVNRWAEKNTKDRKAVNILTFNDDAMYKYIMDTADLDELTEYEFEGHKFLGIKDYDKYLTLWYDDYMELPPAEMRVSHHVTEVYWKD